MTAAFAELPKAVRDNTLNYFDDINGGADSDDDMLFCLEEIFACCRVNNITLKPIKARIGFPTTSFGGFEHGGGDRWIAQ